MKKIRKFLARIYILSIPFYDVPRTLIKGISITGGIFLVLLIVSLLDEPYFLGKVKIKKNNYKILFSFFMFLSIYSISSLFNLELISNKSLNHILFYLYSFLVYTVGTYLIIEKYGLVFLTDTLSVAIIIVTLIGLYEMSLFYTDGYESYANFLNHGRNVGVHLGIPRMRATFNEPSHLALFILPVVFIFNKTKHKSVLYFSLTAILFSLSASAFFGLFTALVIVSPRLFKNFKVRFKVRNILVIIIFIAILYFILPTLPGVYNKIINTESVDLVRYNSWNKSIVMFIENPIIGHGPAGYYQELTMGVFSWYLQILVESGILGLLSLTIFLGSLFIKIKKYNDLVLEISLLSFMFQMISMNHYYVPGFWVLFAYILYLK